MTGIGRTGIARVFDADALLTDEQRAWRGRARALAADLLAPTIDDDFERSRFRTELVPSLGQAGLLGMHLDGYGAAGADPISYGLVCAELEAVDSAWRTLLSVQGSLAMGAIHRFGSEDQRQRWLPGMVTGELVGCFGLTEPTGGSDPAAMVTTATRDGDDWILEGAKRWIGLASVADVAVIWARAADGVRGFLVPRGTPGFSATPITGKLSMRASLQCDIRLDGVRLPADAVLPDAVGLHGPFSSLNDARYGIVWGVLGAARSCIEAALDHAAERTVFGRPIGARQLVQEKLADMTLEYEKGFLLALHLGRLKAAGALTPVQISVGKLNNVREAISIARKARMILGGNGVTDAFPVMRHLANLESVRTYEGTDEIHTLVIGRELTGEDAFS